MCEVLDKIIAEGGRKRAILTAEKMLDDGLDVNVIAKYTLLSIEEINNILENKKT